MDVTAAEATLPLQKVKATLPSILEKYQREFTMLMKQRYFIVNPRWEFDICQTKLIESKKATDSIIVLCFANLIGG